MKPLTGVWNAIGGKLRPRLELPAASGHALGFRPALLDFATMTIYPSRDCMPDDVKGTVVAGFERGGFFYTRRAASRACEEWGYGA